MEELFTSIVTTSLYASVVGFIIILLKKVLQNRLSPKWHFLIWLVFIFKLLVPFGPESSLSLFNVVHPITDNTMITLGNDRILLPPNSVETTQPQYIPNNYSGTNVEVQPIASMSTQIKNILPSLWFIGSIALLTWLIYTYYVFSRRLHREKTKVPEDVYFMLEQSKKKMCVHRKIEIVLQDAIETPSIFGVIKPKILLSPKTLELNQTEISYILLHELAHYKRRDLLMNYLLLGLQVIHWFNPVIWYCFRVIRRDMEMAADEKVLSVLKQGEEKEYGKALIAMLESYNNPKLLPKLIGMVDDKRNMKQRINNIRMAEFFQQRKTLFLTTGIICIALLSAFLLTNPLSDPSTEPLTNTGVHQIGTSDYDASTLLSYKNLYIGNASNVGNLNRELPYAKFHNGMSLQTENTPYGLTVNYDFSSEDVDLNLIEMGLRNNAVVIFALIDNVDLIRYNLTSASGERRVQIPRVELQKSYVKDLREYAKDKNDFTLLLNSIDLKIAVNPPKYTPAMSSTPGIQLTAQYTGKADKVEFSAPSGSFLSWTPSTGNITRLGNQAEQLYDIPVYWTPLHESTNPDIEVVRNHSIPVQVSILRNGEKLAEKQIYIQTLGAGLYTVEQSHGVLIGQTLDEALYTTIRNRGQNYYRGEVATGGYIILDTVEKDGLITVYTIASSGNFGFENGIFTKISGSGAIPTVITFKKDEANQYSLISYREPMDGAGYMDSLEKMFPENLLSKIRANNNEPYQELIKQQEQQAAEYLKSIGRTATVSASHVQKKLLNLSSIPASNKLFADYTKYDPFLINCPYWIGTREKIESGVRYIYETAQSKSDDGYDLVIFTKKKEDGTVIQEARYKIVGDEPQLVLSIP